MMATFSEENKKDLWEFGTFDVADLHASTLEWLGWQSAVGVRIIRSA
jgi:hypothetical protein